MKTYILIVHNGWGYCDERSWIVGAFYSEEAAKEYGHKLLSEISNGEARIDELEDLDYYRGLTDAEEKELNELHDKFDQYNHFEKGSFHIEEHEIRE